MVRRVLNTDLGGRRQRVRVIITMEPCDPLGTHSMKVRQFLLASIVDNPDLTTCGHSPFQKLRIYHDDTTWVAEAESTMDTA